MANSIKEIKDLFDKYLEKKCSEEELQKFYGMLISYDDEKSLKDLIMSDLRGFEGDQHEKYPYDLEKVYRLILSEIKNNEKRGSEKRILQNKVKVRRLGIEVFSMATVFIIAFLLGANRNRNVDLTRLKPVFTETYNEIGTPYGAKSEVKLADGTVVILNAGSKIKYKNDFNSVNRDLVLEGEAYFKVAKNADLPLVVNAGNINIKATGTEFNVKAYSDEEIVETTLVEGHVEISQTGKGDNMRSLELKPCQKAIYTRGSDKLLLKDILESEPLAVKSAKIPTSNILISPKADVDQVTAWTKNKLIIRSEKLENLCIKLQRKYDVTILFGDEEIKKNKFSGVLLDETLQQVLDVIKLTAPIDYTLKGKVVTLVLNKQQKEKYSKRFKN